MNSSGMLWVVVFVAFLTMPLLNKNINELYLKTYTKHITSKDVVIVSSSGTKIKVDDKQRLNILDDNIVSTSGTKNKVDDKKRLNILVLYPDDWRHDSIGSENPIIQTPFLTSLAKHGIRFRHNCVTTSICWISRATFFTGQFGSEHKSLKLSCPHFTREERWNASWPAMLQRLGNYTVGHVGKWQYRNKKDGMFDWSRFHEGQHWYKVKGKRITAAARARSDAIAFLRERPKDRPFALTVAFYPPKPVSMTKKPGGQWTPDRKNRKIYENITIKEPLSVEKGFHSLPEFLKAKNTTARFRFLIRYGSSHHYQESMKNYYALVTQVDKECERIVNVLKKQGLENETMIIFTTDNGMFHGAHGLSGKWYPYQESIRVPLIIYDPRMPDDKRGTLDDSFTLNIDLAKTILGAAGITPPAGMNGRDISDLYLNNTGRSNIQQATPQTINDTWRDEFFYEFPPILKGIPASTALVRKKWKYIYWPQYDYEQLFDLANDPLEMNDLRNDSKLEDIRKEMRDVHDRLRDEVMKPNEDSRYECE